MSPSNFMVFVGKLFHVELNCMLFLIHLQLLILLYLQKSLAMQGGRKAADKGEHAEKIRRT